MITILGYEFDGPFTSTESLKNYSGVYVIHYKNSSGNYIRLDCGESSDVKNRIETHDRKDCWTRNAKGKVTVSAYYCNGAERVRIEGEIRSDLDLPCGEI